MHHLLHNIYDHYPVIGSLGDHANPEVETCILLLTKTGGPGADYGCQYDGLSREPFNCTYAFPVTSLYRNGVFISIRVVSCAFVVIKTERTGSRT